MSGIQDILYVRFSVDDIDKQQQFLLDFGFNVRRDGDRLYARGTDANQFVYYAELGEPQFLGLGFEAASQQDLERIAAIDGATVSDNNAPGGGLIATLCDPDGIAVDIVFGMDRPSALEIPTRSPLNDGADHLRLGSRVEYVTQPHSIKRLGHCVLGVGDFVKSEAWYKDRLGMVVSDAIYVGDENNVVGAFMRCDRGDEYVDHHTIFLLGGQAPGFNHAAFEIADWDCLMSGHYQLQQAGYTHSWGVGKHLLGSQVFDYWRDPHGFMLEHFTDGDLLNKSFGSHKAPIEKLLGSHWGPEGGPT